MLHREQLGGNPEQTNLSVVQAAVAPGQRAAAPPMPGGALNATMYCRGTSNAAALASRAASHVFDTVEAIRGNHPEALPADRDALVLKALLTHGANWGTWPEALLALRPDLVDQTKKRDFVCRWLGYGPVDLNRVVGCTPERATLLGTGELDDGQAMVFSAPLPPTLAGQAIWRRLTVTLGWFSPINPSHRAYRAAKLWITPPHSTLRVRRLNSANDKAVQRGTLQHEVFEGEDAVAFGDGDTLECKVNCAADAGNLSSRIPFALCLTLEVAPNVGVPLYEEIRQRIAAPVQVQAGQV